MSEGTEEVTRSGEAATVLLVGDESADVALILRALKKGELLNKVRVVRDGSRRSTISSLAGSTQTARSTPCRALSCWT